jgi:hypothetical protein
MKTFQIYRTVSQEYFVRAETEADAIRQIDEGTAEPAEQTELSLTVTDEHDGEKWLNEPTGEMS